MFTAQYELNLLTKPVTNFDYKFSRVASCVQFNLHDSKNHVSRHVPCPSRY